MSLLRLYRPLGQLRARSAGCLICRASNTTIRDLAIHAPSTPLDVSPSTSRPPAVDQKKLTHLKHPPRGGQDLSRRYQRLERSIRGKTSYGRGIEHFERSRGVADPAPYTEGENTQEASTLVGKATRRIYRGFVVPETPKPPADDECCMSGCAVCVYDLYDEARTDYIQAMDKLRADLIKLGVLESEWPADIRHDGQISDSSPSPKPSANASLGAFEQLEMALKAKRVQGPSSTNVAQERSEASAAPPVVRKRPPKKRVGMNDVVEGLRWVLFSNR